MTGDRTLLREAAFKYVRTYELYQRQLARGEDDLATDTYSHVQTMERCLTVTEHSLEWRKPKVMR
jgi:hypothetical protein